MALERHFDRVVRLVEGTAAAFLAVIALLTFVSVLGRYLFAAVIPDSFDVGRLMLGIAVFWGLAGAVYRGDHIQVDLLWTVLPQRWRKWLDRFADLLVLAAMGVFAWMMWVHVQSTWRSNLSSFDLNLPIWPFYAVAWLGIVLAALLALIRLHRLLRGAGQGAGQED